MRRSPARRLPARSAAPAADPAEREVEPGALVHRARGRADGVFIAVEVAVGGEVLEPATGEAEDDA